MTHRFCMSSENGYLCVKVLHSMECLLYLSVHNRYALHLMILDLDCVNPCKRRIICRCCFSKRGVTVRFLYAANVVIPTIIFFWSFHNDTIDVWISKTVSIDANYLLKLETFLIHFDEGKGTCMRSFSRRRSAFSWKKEEKNPWWNVRIEIGDMDGEATSYGNVRTLFHSLGQYDKAREY